MTFRTRVSLLSWWLQGRVYEPGTTKDELADAIREFNQFVRNDPRVDVVALPFRDGVSIVTRKCVLDAFLKSNCRQNTTPFMTAILSSSLMAVHSPAETQCSRDTA